MTEEWMPVAGFEGLYEISNFGNVKSLCAGRWGYTIMRKPVPDKDGYLTVNLKKNGKYKSAKIHRLVAQAFLENPNDFPEVNHKDEDKTNNRVDNLEWCTRKYNQNYNGHPKIYCKPVVKMTDDGEVVGQYDSVTAAEKANGIKKGCISAVLTGRRKRTGGFRWQYQS